MRSTGCCRPTADRCASVPWGCLGHGRGPARHDGRACGSAPSRRRGIHRRHLRSGHWRPCAHRGDGGRRSSTSPGRHANPAAWDEVRVWDVDADATSAPGCAAGGAGGRRRLRPRRPRARKTVGRAFAPGSSRGSRAPGRGRRSDRARRRATGVIADPHPAWRPCLSSASAASPRAAPARRPSRAGAAGCPGHGYSVAGTGVRAVAPTHPAVPGFPPRAPAMSSRCPTPWHPRGVCLDWYRGAWLAAEAGARLILLEMDSSTDGSSGTWTSSASTRAGRPDRASGGHGTRDVAALDRADFKGSTTWGAGDAGRFPAAVLRRCAARASPSLAVGADAVRVGARACRRRCGSGQTGASWGISRISGSP